MIQSQAESVEETAFRAEKTTHANAGRGGWEGATAGSWRSCKFSSSGAQVLGEEGEGGG